MKLSTVAVYNLRMCMREPRIIPVRAILREIISSVGWGYLLVI